MPYIWNHILGISAILKKSLYESTQYKDWMLSKAFKVNTIFSIYS